MFPNLLKSEQGSPYIRKFFPVHSYFSLLTLISLRPLRLSITIHLSLRFANNNINLASRNADIILPAPYIHLPIPRPGYFLQFRNRQLYSAVVVACCRVNHFKLLQTFIQIHFHTFVDAKGTHRPA